MLPIFWTLTVGGVSFAITILALALIPPGRASLQFALLDTPASGALIDQSQHPEWRQLLIHAAIRRSDELDRLRTLPETPMLLPEIPDVTPDDLPPIFPAVSDGKGSQEAGLPAARIEPDPDDVTGSFDGTHGATIPIEIGETSSAELPVGPIDERPPVIKSPRTKLPSESPPAKISVVEPAQKASRPRPAPAARERRSRRKPAAATSKPDTKPAAAPLNLLQVFFNAFENKSAAPSDNAAKPAY